MLADSDIAIFDAFGYLVVACDDLREAIAGVERECTANLRAVFGTPESQVRAAAESRCYLPMMGERAPASLALVEDRRVVGEARRLVRGPVVVKPAKVSMFVRPTPWHRDCSTGLRGVKCVFYLGSRTIRLDVVPGSHRAPAGAAVELVLGERWRPWGSAPPNALSDAGIPVHSVAVEPGQVLVFDIALWHASAETAPRAQWAVSYLAAPISRERVPETARYVADFLRKQLAYDRVAHPYFPPSWLAGTSESEPAIAFRESRVLAAYLEVWGDR